jgi:tRNA-splicing ligase RtcB
MATAGIDLIQESSHRWRLERHGDMRVPGIVFASAELMGELRQDPALDQVRAVATLPGIVEASFAMPDIHWGYGFPIGGVAATDVADGGVVSPGGVGFDISCGVRLLTTELDIGRFEAHRGHLLDELSRAIPRGMGPGGVWDLSKESELIEILTGGVAHAVARGHGTRRDLEHCERDLPVTVADVDHVSPRALKRGLGQVGSLGSGNHFLEIQVVDALSDLHIAKRFGLGLGRVVVMIHSGSRGLGHQVCSDHVEAMGPAMARHGIVVPDRQLACAPVESDEGAAYLAAMRAAANFGRVNRQLLTEATRAVFARILPGVELRLLYDVSHNLARLEHHDVDGEARLLCVHRKGATRALPPGHPELPDDLSETGQPVLVPGSMGTASHVLAGQAGSAAFHSACHGAGRRMSRHAARRRIHGRDLEADLEAEGISVRGTSLRGLAEEAPFAYKDVDEVVDTCVRAGLAHRVARLRPIGVVKG